VGRAGDHTYRPDEVVDPDHPNFADNLVRFAQITDTQTDTWDGYLCAHRTRRAAFRALGATATDHGHPSARTEALTKADASALFDLVRKGKADAQQRDAFRGQMLTEMARMSLEDGMVMQVHPGARRNHAPYILDQFGRDKGFDIPGPTDYVRALAPLLGEVGHDPRLTLILFTLDETSYARELAPVAGVYPCLRLGPPWWFFDSVEGIKRFREQTTETAGFYNTVGFNDDTRAFCSIPARHNVARRCDAAYLAELVCTGRLTEDEAHDVIVDLSYTLAKQAYRL